MLDDPVRLNVERRSAPATGVEQQVLPVPQRLKPKLLLAMLEGGEVETALVFTRTKHRANRLAAYLEKNGVACDRIHGNRSQRQRETALAAFKAGRIGVLVATDIASRGIDVEALPHVINFDVPGQPEDYIHRVGRTARASSTGDALTFAAPEEKRELAAIERAVGRRIPRRRIDGFDYEAQPEGRFEVPVGERIAAIRARKRDERERARAKAERKARNAQPRAGGQRRAAQAAGRPSSPRPSSPRRRSAGRPGGGRSDAGHGRR
jgi:ATP-dependent RNA helicase RhlE